MKVLIIDDDPDEIGLFEAANEEYNNGFQFFQAEDCEQALDTIGSINPKFLVVDIHLYPGSGIDCVKLLKAHELAANVPVVMFSTSHNEQSVKQCYEAGADHFFVKPNSLSQINSVLNKLKEMDWNAGRKRENFIIQIE